MATIAGLDLGYGSQTQIVRTNYLYVATKAGDGGTNAQNATYLQCFNDMLARTLTGGGRHPMHCDYIVPLVAGTGAAEPTVTGAAAAGLLLPVMGPTREFLAQQGDLATRGGHTDSIADQGTSANGQILAILASGIVDVTISVTDSIATAASAVALDTLIGTGGAAHALNGALMALTVGAAVDGGAASGAGLGAFFAMGDLAVDLASSDGTPSVEVNTITTSPVRKGNAAGATATDLGSVTGVDTADNHHIVSLISLVRTY